MNKQEIKELKKKIDFTHGANSKQNKILQVQSSILNYYLNDDIKGIIDSLKTYIKFYHTEKQYPHFNANAEISIKALFDIVSKIQDQELIEDIKQIKNENLKGWE